MIRRTVLAATALVVLGGVAAPAVADTTPEAHEDGVICILGTNSGSGSRGGVCAWLPL